ncbi:MAG: pyridoxal-phosphate dependent enzyme [Dehalococcoidia bacterium]|nr:MAG: pyridoxal-phosphate dependent enzyme [Dehalococcoidia bacterium]
MTDETALPSHTIAPATAAAMSFIGDTVLRLRMDGERLEPQQFIVVRREGGDGIVAFGRIKPYQETHELGSVAVVEEERGRGWGRLVVRELIRRFPQDEVFITTDLPEYFERLGFLRTDILPQEIEDKISRVCQGLRSGAVGMVYDRRIQQRPTLADVYRARHAIEPYLKRTPLMHNPYLSRLLGCQAYLKLENLQPIGVFKVRGGVNLAARLGRERRRGIIGASTGNHGQSLAYGARLVGMRCVIAMPRRPNPLKVEAIQALGAEVAVHGGNFEEARAWAERFARSEGMRYVHHVNTPELVAGVATVSLEIVEELPDVDVIIAPVGGGSGASGHCIVAKALRPDVQVIGVQAEGAPAVYRSWKDHRLQQAPIDTFADGLATGSSSFVPVRTFIDHLDDMLLVSDDEMREAIALLLRAARQLAEPAGAAATAAALKLGERLKGKKVALILSGGNLPTQELRRILSHRRRPAS